MSQFEASKVKAELDTVTSPVSALVKVMRTFVFG